MGGVGAPKAEACALACGRRVGVLSGRFSVLSGKHLPGIRCEPLNEGLTCYSAAERSEVEVLNT